MFLHSSHLIPTVYDIDSVCRIGSIMLRQSIKHIVDQSHIYPTCIEYEIVLIRTVIVRL